jgi:hypothetical protein
VSPELNRETARGVARAGSLSKARVAVTVCVLVDQMQESTVSAGPHCGLAKMCMKWVLFLLKGLGRLET